MKFSKEDLDEFVEDVFTVFLDNHYDYGGYLHIHPRKMDGYLRKGLVRFLEYHGLGDYNDMKTASAKAKGRSLAQKIAILLRTVAGLGQGDVHVTSSGTTGPDITFSDLGTNEWPFAIECKKHASFAVYQHYKQAVGHAKKYGGEPLLIIEADRSEPLVVVDAEWFFRAWAILNYEARQKR